MQLGPSQILKCPYCGRHKALLSLISGNTHCAELWHDGKSIYPMLPQLSTIQKCLGCGKYSLIDYWKDAQNTVNKPSTNTGELTYAETKEAYLELGSSKLNKKDAYKIALTFIHAYNDEFVRPRFRKAIQEHKSISSISGNFPTPTDEDRRLVIRASYEAIDTSENKDNAMLMKTELYRSLGCWEKAYDILINLPKDNHNWIIDILLYHIAQKDTSLLPLVIEGKRINYYNKANLNAIVEGNDSLLDIDRNRNIASYLNKMPESRRKDIVVDALGGIYDKSSKSLLKLVTPSPVQYEIEHGIYSICDYAFYRNNDIKALKLTHPLNSIGVKAFYGCKNLAYISLIETKIEFLGNCAFMNCKSLTNIDFLDSLKVLGYNVFAGMDKLRSIRLPDSIDRIPEFTFFECSSLETVNIPINTHTIDSYSFQHTAIKELTIPNNVILLGDAVFSRCFNLESIKLSTQLKSIPERTFDACKALNKIIIPKSIKEIGKYAFRDTESLKLIQFKGKISQIHETAFENSGIEKIIVPFWTKSYYKRVFPNIKIETSFI